MLPIDSGGIGSKRMRESNKATRLNSSGRQSSIQASPAGQTHDLRHEDWNFAALSRGARSKAARTELIAACCYEYARESKRVREAAVRWLELVSVRRKLMRRVERITKQWAKEAVRVRGEGSSRRGEAVSLENCKRVAQEQFHDIVFSSSLAKRLPSTLVNRYRELFPAAQNEMRKAEKCCIYAVGNGAPRLSRLATHLADDRPWLLIPEADRQATLASAADARFDLLLSASGLPRDFAPAFERVHWRNFEPPAFTDPAADPNCFRNGKLLPEKLQQKLRQQDAYRDIIWSKKAARQKLERIVTVEDPVSGRRQLRTGIDAETARRLAPDIVGDEVLPIRIRWGHFTNAEIVEDFKAWLEANRPEKWRDLAVHSGRPERENWFATRLKNLAALRLQHFYRPAEAWQKFCSAWPGEDRSNYNAYRTDALRWFQRLSAFRERPRHFAKRQ